MKTDIYTDYPAHDTNKSLLSWVKAVGMSLGAFLGLSIVYAIAVRFPAIPFGLSIVATIGALSWIMVDIIEDL